MFRLATFAVDAVEADEVRLALLTTPPQPATATRLAAVASAVPADRQWSMGLKRVSVLTGLLLIGSEVGRRWKRLGQGTMVLRHPS